MTRSHLKTARLDTGWTQHQAAVRLGVSQPYYSQLENGSRPMPSGLARRAARQLRLSPLALPLPPLALELAPIDPPELTAALARRGYAGFAHLRKTGQHRNPAELVARALAHADLDVRLVEALPWILATFQDLDWAWLVAQCRLVNLQNRLGFMAVLAGQTMTPGAAGRALRDLPSHLEPSRLAGEATLCRDSMSRAERNWVRQHRSPDAAHWNLLTTLTVAQLTHAV